MKEIKLKNQLDKELDNINKKLLGIKILYTGSSSDKELKESIGLLRKIKIEAASEERKA